MNSYFLRSNGIKQLFILLLALAAIQISTLLGQDHGHRTYSNMLKPITKTEPILADYPQYFEPIQEEDYFESPPLIADSNSDLSVRSWRFSYNARGIVLMTNHLRAADTAIIMVHPWGIDDGQGWKTPDPAGVSDFCTPKKNHLVEIHEKQVVNPFLKLYRGKVKLVMFSLPGNEDPIRKKLYRSFSGKPADADRAEGAKELSTALNRFDYHSQPLPSSLEVSTDKPMVDYFRLFPGLNSGPRYDPPGFWELPIPVTKSIDVDSNDVIIYDAQGYSALKGFLVKQNIRHVLLVGYATDKCYRATTAGYENLSKDFDVFLVGDATLATFPGNSSPRFATNAAISYAAIDHMITQISWIKYKPTP